MWQVRTGEHLAYSDGGHDNLVVGRDVSSITQDVAHESPNPVVAGLVGSGLLKLNPALASVAVTSVAGSRTGAIVAGTAKEGLIKQHAGAKAAKKVAEAIRQSLAAR